MFGLSAEETSYGKRGFRGATDEIRARLEQIGSVFLRGYHSAIEAGAPTSRLTGNLAAVEHELRGFAFEGAAMGLALLDVLTPWRANRIQEFLAGAGDAHAYMVHVGTGWIWARMPLGIERTRRRLDPLLVWLAFDGWGFHEGYFHWPNYIRGQGHPRRISGYAARVFDQGLGRSFWFVNGGNPELIAATIQGFAPARQANLWSGIGLAATYAGITTPEVLDALKAQSLEHWPSLAQGAAFASKARQRAGNLTPYTEVAARTFCGLSALEAARLTDTTLENLASTGSQPAYEIWRERIQGHFRTGKASASPIITVAAPLPNPSLSPLPETCPVPA